MRERTASPRRPGSSPGRPPRYTPGPLAPPDHSPLLDRLLPDPRGSEGGGRWWDRASYLLFAATLVIALWTYGDYGITWDEWPHIGYGDRIARFWGTGFKDLSSFTFRTNYYYGGGYDFLGAIFRWFADPMPNWKAIHLLGCIVGVVGVVGTWKLGRRLAGPFAGFVAALFLVLNPVYYGHIFNNPKDMPFAVGYVWSLYYMVDAIAQFPRVPRRVWIKLALWTGAAMSVRIAGVLLLCYLGLAVVLYAGLQGLFRRSASAAWSYLERIGLRVAAMAAGAWAVMLIAWPWAIVDPIRRPFITLMRMSQYNEHKRRMPFAGEDIWNFDVGWNYLPHYFGYQLPEVLLALFLLGTVYGVAVVLRRIREPRYVLPALALLTLGISIWMPPLYAIYKGSILYDGYRHFLFVVPPLTVLAALLVDLSVAGLARRIGRTAWVLAALFLALVGGDLLRTMIILHPHEYVYFNRLIGGVGGAHGQYDTDYYGNTFKEAAEGMADYAWRTEPETYLDTIYYYSGCVSSGSANRYLPPNFRGHKTRPGKSKHADFYLGYTRGHCDRKYGNAPIAYSVNRFGADLNLVKDIRALEAAKLERETKMAEMRATAKAARESGDDPVTIDPKRLGKLDREMGPALPPALAAERVMAERNPEYGPPLPPALAAERAAKRATLEGSDSGAGTIGTPMGPALSPELAAERAQTAKPSKSPAGSSQQ